MESSTYNFTCTQVFLLIWYSWFDFKARVIATAGFNRINLLCCCLFWMILLWHSIITGCCLFWSSNIYRQTRVRIGSLLRFTWLQCNREERGKQQLNEYLEQIETLTYNSSFIPDLLLFWYSWADCQARVIATTGFNRVLLLYLSLTFITGCCLFWPSTIYRQTRVFSLHPIWHNFSVSAIAVQIWHVNDSLKMPE